MPGIPAHLPDALVALAPAVGGSVRHLNQEVPGGLVQRAQLVAQPARRAQQLAVDVELALIPGAVPDAHGPAPAPAGQVAQRPLREVVLAADSEHDLEVGLAHPRRGGRGHPGEEAVCLVGAGRHPERLQRQAGVAHPGVPVVPVALTAHGLGKGGGGGGDDGAGRLEGKRLEDTAAVLDQLPPGAGIALVDVGPGPPSADGGLQPLLDHVLGPGIGGHFRAPLVLEREADLLALVQAEGGRGR